MKHVLAFTVAAAALIAATPARAAYVVASFTGTVQSSVNPVVAPGSTVNGSFFLDTGTNTVRSYVINGVSIGAGAVPVISETPDQFTALYEGQISAVATGGAINSTFALDLEGLTKFTSANPLTVLANLAAQSLDINPADAPFNSTFSYSTQNANGTNLSQLVVNLTSITASVPEPASLALLATSLFGLSFARRRA